MKSFINDLCDLATSHNISIFVFIMAKSTVSCRHPTCNIKVQRMFKDIFTCKVCTRVYCASHREPVMHTCDDVRLALMRVSERCGKTVSVGDGHRYTKI